ncbi:hypothetical protein MNB_SV-3-1175 [hydrothermal vent metagenome]|uniref:DUF4832 domain-containing protein n=1 Tax=hydrothermal vent metagenome TaxID=652676 RepID=A0A1W1CM41_9ZZZZ
MILKLILGFLFGFLFLGCSGGGTSEGNKLLLKIDFTEESSINTSNPDRGFYDADYELNADRDYNMFEEAKENGYTLVYAPLNLEEYNTTKHLPETLLDTINTNLNYAVESGVKLIFRIKYRGDLEGNDPQKEIILGHLDQLKSILQKHKEIISIIQAGTIGAWGEWHSFTGDYAETDKDYKKNRRDIIAKLSDIFPQKYIQLRTPMHKELLYGSLVKYDDADEEKAKEGMITKDIAFTQDIRAKTGHHNDCFLSSKTDSGTYPSHNIAFWKSYVANDTKYAPVGGETCKDDDTYTTCSNAINTLKELQYSYLNHAYHPDVIQRWKDEGCYRQINENLGYRLVAKTLTLQKSDYSVNLSLTIENKGFASPYIKSEVNFILKSDAHTYRFKQAVDMRTFFPNEVKQIKYSLPLEDIENAEYCLYLQIGKDYSSIRLSNTQLWDESNNANKLACNIVME